MTTNLETLILDSAGASPLTLQSGGMSSLDAFDPGVAQRRPTWAQGAESNGGLLVADPPYDDAQGSFRVRFFPTAAKDMPAALTLLHTLVGKLQECSASGPSGLACSWTPANHTSTYTLYLKLAEVDGLPIEMSGDMAGWFAGYPVVTVKFVRDPFLYGAAIDTVTDTFATNTLATDYTFDAGSGTISVSGGQLVPSDTAVKALYRIVGGYDGAGAYYDVQVTLKFTTGASVATPHVTARRFKFLDANNFLRVAQVDGNLKIQKHDGGVTSDLASAAYSLSTATSYWLRGRVEGNVVYARIYTSDPVANPSATPAQSTSYTLTGADATKFGQGVSGRVGSTVQPKGTDWRYDDFVIEPNVWVSA